MELNLSQVPLPQKTPVGKNQRITRCVLTFLDGTELTLEPPVDQGLYSITEYVSKNQKLIIHEVFITYGHS